MNLTARARCYGILIDIPRRYGRNYRRPVTGIAIIVVIPSSPRSVIKLRQFQGILLCFATLAHFCSRFFLWIRQLRTKQKLAKFAKKLLAPISNERWALNRNRKDEKTPHSTRSRPEVRDLDWECNLNFRQNLSPTFLTHHSYIVK